jgi:hypothetical protein
MPTAGKMQLTIKINEFLADVQTVENGWKRKQLNCVNTFSCGTGFSD